MLEKRPEQYARFHYAHKPNPTVGITSAGGTFLTRTHRKDIGVIAVEPEVEPVK